MPIKIAFVITGLGIGGAERMLIKLLSTIDRSKFDCTVICLSDRTELQAEFMELAIPVHVIGSSSWKSFYKTIGTLVHLLNKISPQIVQGWMYHGSIASQVACALTKAKPKVLWNIRAAMVSPQLQKLPTRLLVHSSRFIARYADGILNNSFASAKYHHVKFGYPAHLTKVIPNGFDTEFFKPNPKERLRVRSEIGISVNTVLIGHIARLDASKDHANLLRAINILARRHLDYHLLLVGAGISKDSIATICRESGLPMPEKISLFGARSDIASIQSALDIGVISSISEGFPNSIGEAMSCGVPCVVTDVGDCRELVGNTGFVVPKENSDALAQALVELVTSLDDRVRLGALARERIVNKFSLSSVAKEYEAFYELHVNATGSRPCVE